MYRQSFPLIRTLAQTSNCTARIQAQYACLSSVKVSLVDKFDRQHDYLRVSLTERCNLRCRYCMPEEGIQLSKREDCLDLEELKRLTSIFVNLCNVKKIRLTGGEPTIDKKLVPLLEYLNEIRQNGHTKLKTLAMTTNGLTLKRHSALFKKLGLDAINVSLDTLKADRFEQMTRRNGFELAYRGLLTAIETGFASVKLNCVIMKGVNDDEIVSFSKLALKHPVEIRFIEFMPFAGNGWASNQMLPYKDMLGLVKESFPDLKRIQSTPESSGGKSMNETSKIYKSRAMVGSIGFISSMSDNFCSGCNRLRLTTDGHLKVCLFGRDETSLRDLVRNGATDYEIVKAIECALVDKKKQHAGASNLQHSTSRPMIKVGARVFHTSSNKHSRSSSSVSDDDKNESSFSHLNKEGLASMVNVSEKVPLKRIAKAQGKIYVGLGVITALKDRAKMKKGDILSVSKVAGIMGSKLTSHLIPLCHQIPLDHVNVDIELCESSNSLLVSATVEAHHKTGVEMESLTAVTITLLTLYDMCKSVNKSMIISDIKLISKDKA